MVHRYQHVVQVHLDCGKPGEFVWRGRRYRVLQVLSHWVEAVPWWVNLRGTGHGASLQRTVWRVEATSRAGTTGVYDLCVASDRWRLLRVID